MSNMRILYNNVADKATLTASSTAGSLGVAALLTDIKSDVWRATSGVAQITATWSLAQVVGVVVLPFCNLSGGATIRVRGYTLATDALPLLDTGYTQAATTIPLDTTDTWSWGLDPLGVNAYTYGSGYGSRTYAVSWVTVGAYEKLVIDIDDTYNPAGYVEVSRLVAGYYYEASINPQHGVDVGIADTSKHERSDAGDLITNRGTTHKTLSLNLSVMPVADRNIVWRLLRNGVSKPFFLSLVPNATDAMEEQVFQIYGKLSRQGAIKYQFVNQYNTTLEVEEI